MERDYEYLEGKIIDWVSDICNTYKVRVAAIDYDIGITLVLSEPTYWGSTLLPAGYEVTCLNGECSPNNSPKGYKTHFYTIVAGIKKGVVDTRIGSEVQRMIENRSFLGSTMAECAYK